MNVRSTSFLLYLIARTKPEIWDLIHPHGLRVSGASREYLAAMAVKGFAAELGQHTNASELEPIQKMLVKFATERMAAEFDDDNWCWTGRPPIPIPHGFGFSLDEFTLNPQPLPPKEMLREIAGYLLMLSEATTHEGAAKELTNVASGLAR